MSYNINSKPWSPKPMRTNTSSNHKPVNGKQKFAQSMAQNAPGSDMPYMVMNLKRTENGALAYSTTGKALLDINYQLSSLRGKDERIIIDMFRKAFAQNPILSMRWLFYASDVREGAGERRVFKVIIKDIIKNGGSQMVANLVPLIPEYIRWDMLYTLLEVTDNNVYQAVKNLIITQWNNDITHMLNNEPISLMAKWLKSANSHNAETRQKGLQTVKLLGISEREYRKNLSALRNYLEVVETRMSSNNWQAVDYEKVPSKANLIYNNAFLRHDTDRRRMYLNALSKGEAKVNSSVAYPYEILHKTATSYDAHAETLYQGMWDSLPNMLGDDYSDTLVVCDDSGSMERKINNTTVTARTVAFALSIYMAERNKGAFKDMVMTFSRTPKLRVLEHNWSLKQKYGFMRSHSEVANTNIKAVFDLILDTAIKNGYSQSDLPSRILILSDGEWDAMTDDGMRHGYRDNGLNMTLFRSIEVKFKSCGYVMPKLVFWNLANRSATIPFNENEAFPCTLVSGFSVNIFKMVLSNKTNPWDALVDQLMVPRYDAVEEKAFPKVDNTRKNDVSYKSNNTNRNTIYNKDKVPGGVTIRGRVNSGVETAKSSRYHVAKVQRVTKKKR